MEFSSLSDSLAYSTALCIEKNNEIVKENKVQPIRIKMSMKLTVLVVPVGEHSNKSPLK